MANYDPCMICRSTDFELLKTSDWTISGLGKISVSFGLCRDCGHISQNPCPPGHVIDAFYTEMSNYFRPDPNWMPPSEPVSATTRRLVEGARRFKPDGGSLYAIGCGSGRDQFYLAKDGWDVSGCEPSAEAAAQASKLIGTDIEVGFASDCLTGGRQFDVIVLSHVLEHVADPRNMIELVHQHLAVDGLFLVEVPCARQAHLLCPGWLTLEHLSYFSTDILTRLLEESGFLPLEITIDDCSHKYPTITVACRKTKPGQQPVTGYQNGYSANSHMMQTYLLNDCAHWQAVENRFQHVAEAYIYAAGVHTAQLMSETNLPERVKIIDVVDSSPLKVGKKQGEREIISKNRLLADYAGEHVIISSFNSETQIAEMLARDGVPEDKIVCLYN